MTVLQQILEWSKERPSWQRDALRRLVLNGELSAEDIDALSTICRSEHGLADKAEVMPLANGHIPTKSVGAAAVSLVSITHHKGVNALAEDQTLKFAPNLTVVYGDKTMFQFLDTFWRSRSDCRGWRSLSLYFASCC